MLYLYFAQGAFTVWMLLEAHRRRAPGIWYAIIILVPVLGAWVYFFTVITPEYAHLRWWPFGSVRPSLDELRQQVEQAPTLAGRLELAEVLMERGQHAEAIPLLEAARRQEPEHCPVLYALAYCHVEQGHPEIALPLLDQIINREPGWSDYEAWRLLVAARAQGGDSEGALATARDLARIAPTLQHRCLLAERLLAERLLEEARCVLEEALEAHRFASRPVRRRGREWVSRARQLRRRCRLASRA